MVLVHEPAQMSLWDMLTAFMRNGFEEVTVKAAIVELLEALDFLHTDAHAGNMLAGSEDHDRFRRLESVELTNPVERKPVSADWTIYVSRMMIPQDGPMLLSDFSTSQDRARTAFGYDRAL